jgi:hypothetical protein
MQERELPVSVSSATRKARLEFPVSSSQLKAFQLGTGNWELRNRNVAGRLRGNDVKEATAYRDHG